MNKEAIEKSLDHGIKLLSNQIEGAVIPYDDNVFILKQFLIQLATGQLAIAPAMQQEPGEPGEPGPGGPGGPGPGGGPAGAPPSPTPRKKTPRKKAPRKKKS